MKPITIIGGGLAGLTLGIALRERGVPVTVIEAGHYPRHRVCGEFISGAGLEVLRSLRIEELIRSRTRSATGCAFFSENRRLFRRALPYPAVTISRFHLDEALARRFRRLGGELREGERWRGQDFEEGVVCAMGRRARPVENGWRWFGLKVHALGVELEADLEMHFGQDSYVGLCRLENDPVNVCGLFRRRTTATGHGESLDWLRGPPGSLLFARLENAECDPESFCAVAGLSLNPERIHADECRIGDALTMIPPVTGNGMSMAFESAQLALPPLHAYARAEADWGSTTRGLADVLQCAFARRLRWANLFHRALFSRFNSPSLRLVFASQLGWRAAFAATR